MRFLVERVAGLVDVVPTDLFNHLRLQERRGNLLVARATVGGRPIGVARRRPRMNRRVEAVRGLFEHAVISGAWADNPVPSARRSSGRRAKRRGPLAHRELARAAPAAVWSWEARRLPESLGAEEISDFLADLATYRERAIVLLMVTMGRLRAAEVRSLRLADGDMGLRRVRVTGKGGRDRVVPVERAFFAELGAFLREERAARPRPAAGCAAATLPAAR